MFLAISVHGYFIDTHYYYFDERIDMVVDSGKMAIEIDTAVFEGWNDFLAEADEFLESDQPEILGNGDYLFGLVDIDYFDTVMALLDEYTGVSEINPSFITPDDMNYYLGNYMTVLFKDEVSAGTIDSIIDSNSLTIDKYSAIRPQLYIFESAYLDKMDILDLANNIQENGLSEFATPSFWADIILHGAPDDYYYPEQYYLHPDTTDHELATAYNMHDTSLIIALLDTGLEPHEDLPASRIFGGGNYIYSTNPWLDYSLSDVCYGTGASAHFHGIATSGIIAATINNEIDVAGYTNCVKLMMQKIIDCYASAETNNITVAIIDAVDSGAVVINNSWGYTSCIAPFSDITWAIHYAYTSGVLVVFSSGNCTTLDGPDCGDCVPFPANLEDVLCVGATDGGLNRWTYSMYDKSDTIVDVIAPGTGIYTLDQMGSGSGYAAMSDKAPNCSNEYDVICGVDGTSYAAPQLCGLAAMLMTRRPDLIGEPDSLKKIIYYSTGRDWHSPPVESNHHKSTNGGYGIINAAKALMAVSHGDCNNDITINMLDNTHLIDYLYNNGPPPTPNTWLGDVDCSGAINVLDIIYLINYIYKGGPKPPYCYKF